MWLIVAMLPALYALSIGPACWLVTNRAIPYTLVAQAYNPLIRCIMKSPTPARHLAQWYCDRPHPKPQPWIGSWPVDGTETPFQDQMDWINMTDSPVVLEGFGPSLDFPVLPTSAFP